MTTPLILAYVGMAVMLTLSCTGSAIGVTMGGNTTIAALKKKPEIFGKSMLLCVLPSTQGLYGFAAFFLMLSSLGGMEDASQVLTMNQSNQAGQPRMQRYQRDVQRQRRLLQDHDSRRIPRALRYPLVRLRLPRPAVNARTQHGFMRLRRRSRCSLTVLYTC